MEEASATVRRVDEDRWLASRFAPAAQRAHLIAIYALNFVIAHAVENITQPALGDIKLAWWREALEDLAANKPPRAHPALEAYAPHFDAAALPHWLSIIEARSRDLDPAPFEDQAALDAYLVATSGNLMRLAASACGAELSDTFVENAARAWGYAGLLRSTAHWAARGRAILPGSVTPRALILDGGVAYWVARAERVPSAAFPGIGYITLAPRYYSALGSNRRMPSLFTRQLALLVASLTF